jgi:hypothetical protein
MNSNIARLPFRAFLPILFCLKATVALFADAQTISEYAGLRGDHNAVAYECRFADALCGEPGHTGDKPVHLPTSDIDAVKAATSLSVDVLVRADKCNLNRPAYVAGSDGRAHTLRIKCLAQPVDAHRPSNLKKIGDCELTKIVWIGSRLDKENPEDDEEGNGSAITYANGVSGVSEEIEPAITTSRIGGRGLSLPRRTSRALSERGRSWTGLFGGK